MQSIKSTVINVKIPYEVTNRREGDAGSVYADAKLASQEMGWISKHSLKDMCADTYRWQRNYPDGFKSRLNGIQYDLCK